MNLRFQRRGSSILGKLSDNEIVFLFSFSTQESLSVEGQPPACQQVWEGVGRGWGCS